jgi:ferredoxin
MGAPSRPIERAVLKPLTAADALLNRLYGSRFNPLYQSGTIVIALLLIMIVSGLWLILFYRVGSPYESVAAITANPWMGRWVRGVHRYASGAAVLFTLVHMLRMLAQGRSWGPRTLAWTSGVVALGVLLICAITGYVMVWDTFGQLLAREGARMLDSLPILSEPIGRAFTGEQEPAASFFFVNLFAHIALPLGLALILWVHVSRVARPALLPPGRVTWTFTALLVALALVRPVPMLPRGNPFRLPEHVPADLFAAFWLPVSRSLPPGVALGLACSAALLMLGVPLFTRRRGNAARPPSVVDEDICTGCTQCVQDCPYDAIAMIPRASGSRSATRSAEVARVDPDICVSCGICAGSCAPMGVGPPGRTGRDQLVRVREFIPENGVAAGRTVVVCCNRGAFGWRRDIEAEGAMAYEVDCAGNLHSSVVELLVRAGASGVLVISCPPRDCWNREGPTWLFERTFNDREAELQARVDRRRVRIASANASEGREAIAALREFMASTAALDEPESESAPEIELECETVGTEEDT